MNIAKYIKGCIFAEVKTEHKFLNMRKEFLKFRNEEEQGKDKINKIITADKDYVRRKKDALKYAVEDAKRELDDRLAEEVVIDDSVFISLYAKYEQALDEQKRFDKFEEYLTKES